MTPPESASIALDRPFETQLSGRPMATAARYEVEDPTTGRRLADAPDCSAEEVDRVIRAAAEAQRAWALQPLRARAAKVRELAGLLRAHADELDAGFPVSSCRPTSEIMADHALALAARRRSGCSTRSY